MQLKAAIEIQAAKPNIRSKLKNALLNKLSGYLDQYESEDITSVVFESRMKKAIAQAYEDAYSKGSGGYLDESYIQDQLEKEYGFIRSMFRDMSREQTRMPLGERLRMYANKVGAMYYAGKVREGSKASNIVWHLGPTDQNCEDCIRMANNSPYTMKSLKTYPGAGDTRCLTNCQCWLSFQ